MLFTQNLLLLIRFSLRMLSLFRPFPYKLISKSYLLTFDGKGYKSEIFQHNLQIIFSAVIAFQLYRFRSVFQSGMIYEGILYTFLPLAYVILIRIYFKRNKNVVEIFNILVTFEQKLIRGKINKIKNTSSKTFKFIINPFRSFGTVV